MGWETGYAVEGEDVEGWGGGGEGAVDLERVRWRGAGREGMTNLLVMLDSEVEEHWDYEGCVIVVPVVGEFFAGERGVAN